MHEPIQDMPIADDTDHSMNALNANPMAYGSRAIFWSATIVLESISYLMTHIFVEIG